MLEYVTGMIFKVMLFAYVFSTDLIIRLSHKTRFPIRKDWQIIKNLRRSKERYDATLDILSWSVPFFAVYSSFISFLSLCIVLLQIKSVTEPDESFDLIWSTIMTLIIALSWGFIIYMRWDGSFAIIMCTTVPIFALGLLIYRIVRRHVAAC